MSPNNDKSSDEKPELTEESKDNNQLLEPTEKWMIRECDIYKDEYDECTSVKGRFHQYFIYGETQDCNQWKKDYLNCCKWVNGNDVKAGEAIINSEKARRLQRLRPHYQNNVWNRRESPPADWDKPLPDWMVKRNENSYLSMRAKEIKDGTEESSSYCTIM